ncbi:MAG: oligosaccharide repeat unit polymerase [Bacteroidales bacterium]|nr:oligosaccharide repeat unit polymerase [Bacteroidales bacterium]
MFNLLILGAITIEIIFFIVIMQKKTGYLINLYSVFAAPFIFSYIPILFFDYIFSFKFLFVSLISFTLLFIVFFIFDNRRKNVNIKVLFHKNKVIVLYFLFALQLIATIVQIISVLKLLGVNSMYEVFTQKAVLLEEYFLLSGWAFLFRMNLPLIIIFEFYKEEVKNNKFKYLFIIILQIYLVFTTFIRFNKTEPIIALLSIIFVKYYLGKINIKKIIIFILLVSILPFFINYYYFTPKTKRNMEYVKKIVADKFITYLSLSHLTFNEILINKPLDLHGDDNFQFITGSIKRIISSKKVEVKRGNIVEVAGKKSNVYSYWGAFYSQFSIWGIILSNFFMAIIAMIKRTFNYLPINVLILSYLSICFFGNMFQFLIFWWHLFILILIKYLNFYNLNFLYEERSFNNSKL